MPMASHLRNLSIRAFFTPSPTRTLTPLSRKFTVTPFHLAQQRNTMATEAPKKIEWLVVIPDFPGAQAKRLEVRP